VKAEDLATAERSAIFTGRYATNPSPKKLPIWVGNFVLMEYGTGAIMAVLRTIQRRLRVLPQYGLPIRVVVQLRTPAARPGKNDCGLRRQHENGKLVHSGP